MNQKRFVGFIIILTGMLISLSRVAFTGAVVGVEKSTIVGSIGALTVFVGLLMVLMSQATGLVKKISLYESATGKARREEDKYEITDPELYFSKEGHVNISEFKKGIEELKEDSELVNLVREDYGKKLLEIRESAKNLDPKRAQIATKFLEVLYDKGKIPQSEREIGGYSEKEHEEKIAKDEIRRAFDRGWYGEPTSEQRKTLKKYELDFTKGKTHGKIFYLHNPDKFIPVSSTPSSTNAGKHIANDILKYLIKKSA